MTQITVRAIASVVAEARGVSLNEMRSLRRDRRISFARHMVAGLMKELTERSFPEAGRVMNKDKTTIMHSADRCAFLRGADADFARDYAACRQVLLALAERNLSRAAEGLDPVEIAQRVVRQGDRGAHGVSVFEIRAMAQFIADSAANETISGEDENEEADIHQN